jgi:histidinol-phosphate aminotransferase
MPMPRRSWDAGSSGRSTVRFEEKCYVEDGLDLRNCELLHPAADELLREAISSLGPHAFRAYPAGSPAVQTLAGYHGVADDEIMLTAGSDAAIGTIVDAFARPGSRLVVHAPNYPHWEHYAALRGVRVLRVPVAADDAPDHGLDAVRRAVRTTPRAVVVIANPNSPTGLALDPDAVATLARDATAHGHVAVVDECYAAFAGFSHVCLLRGCAGAVVLHSYSKAFPLAGARVAAVISRPEILDRLRRFRLHSSISGPGLTVLAQLVERVESFRPIWREIVDARNWLASDLARRCPLWRVLPSGGNFVTLATGDQSLAVFVVERLREEGVWIRAVNDPPGLAGCLRISAAYRPLLGAVPDLVAEAADRWQADPSRRDSAQVRDA